MKITLFPSSIGGVIVASRSKSSMQRSCALALIRKGKTYIRLPGDSDDDKAALSIISDMGASIERISEEELLIESEGLSPKTSTINCGEAGLSIRMFTPIISTLSKEMRITGVGSLRSRPMHFFEETLPSVGVSVRSSDGKLPLVIRGPLHPQNISVSGALSSQYITGLLMAYACVKADTATIHVQDLKSKPYIALTMRLMEHFGYDIRSKDDYSEFYFEKQTYKRLSTEDIRYTIEGDWSGAAFLIVAASIAGDICIKGLESDSLQADRAMLQALKNAGVYFEWKDASTLVVKKSTVLPFDFDATDCPDLFPPLVALAAYAKGTTTIKGADRLVHKESNRALSLREEFGKLGVSISLEGDLMRVEGTAIVKGATDCSSHHDHRIAMAVAVAALKADSEITIDHAEAINKSYPDFYIHIESLRVK